MLGTLENPHKIEVGEKVTQSGIYDMDIDWYHDDCCIGPSISSTQAKRILHCPLKFWQQSPLNPNRLPEIKKKETSYFDFGKAGHTLFLGDEEFKEKYVVREIENKDWKDWRKKAASEWRAEQHAKGMGVLTMDDMERLRRLSNVIRQDTLIRDNQMMQGFIERSLIYFDRKRSIFIKVRPDVLPPLDLTVTDLKTIGQDADLRTIDRQLNNLDYHIQFGLISLVYRKLFGKQIERFWLLMVENSDFPAYSINPVVMDDVLLGEKQATVALDLLEHGLRTDDWPTYHTNLYDIGLYQAKRDRIQTELAAHNQYLIDNSRMAAE